MRKIILIISIFVLIFVTSLVKNSTKKIEDQIFVINENIRLLNTDYSNVLLEYNYLSSPKKLIQYQSQYFEDDLVKMSILKIKKITKNNEGKLTITDLTKKLKNNE